MKKRHASISMQSNYGFTLLEVMIAVAIFGFLMLYVSQMMRTQIQTYNQTLQDISLEQKTRTSMMHILNEIQLHRTTYYKAGDDSGIYYMNPNPPGPDIATCLIDVNPIDIDNLPVGTGIYYYNKQLLFRDITNNATYLIADQIDSVTFTQVSGYLHLIQIEVVAKNPQTSQTYELLTWSRLY